MKTRSIVILIAIIIALVAVLGVMIRNLGILKEEYKTSVNNNKAYALEILDKDSTNIVYKFRVDQLNYYVDSITIALNNTIKELKIKDNKLRSLQYLETATTKIDTFLLNDTIFSEIVKYQKVDTIKQDIWYSIRLELDYPNKVTITPYFNNIAHIITYDKKETVEPRKKFFISRWFQKKQTIRIVEVIEKSPYCTNKKQRFIEIIK